MVRETFKIRSYTRADKPSLSNTVFIMAWTASSKRQYSCKSGACNDALAKMPASLYRSNQSPIGKDEGRSKDLPFALLPYC